MSVVRELWEQVELWELWEQQEFSGVLSDIWPPSQSDNCASVFLPATGIFGVSPHPGPTLSSTLGTPIAMHILVYIDISCLTHDSVFRGGQGQKVMNMFLYMIPPALKHCNYTDGYRSSENIGDICFMAHFLIVTAGP